jgi:4-amino-4-deoxy-L-arabinose transferase-like glycosyltransferase
VLGLHDFGRTSHRKIGWRAYVYVVPSLPIYQLPWHQLSHYTYWYDHPPLGWIQIAGYAWLTGAWSRAPYAVAVGREFMLVVDVLACALLFLLARRLSFRRWAAAAAVVLFAAAPVALHFHRMVFLDNIEMMWIIAALALAASGRRSLGSAAGSAICLSVAVLTKETAAILAPFVLYMLWQHSDVRTRRYRIAAFATLAGALTLFYPMYALLKNELFEGPGRAAKGSMARM